MSELKTTRMNAVDLRTVPIPVQRAARHRRVDILARPRSARWPSSSEVSRRLRVLVGVDEEILADVPEERARYSCMGALVLAAGIMATFSASVFLSKVGVPFLLVLPLALLWGLLILSFDRALV